MLYFQLFIGKRIEEANIEQEIWKIGNDIKNPKKENDWSLVTYIHTYLLFTQRDSRVSMIVCYSDPPIIVKNKLQGLLLDLEIGDPKKYN